LAAKKTRKLEIDNFKMAWYLIKVNDVQVKLINGKNIHLEWKTSDIPNSSKSKIYRSNKPHFSVDEAGVGIIGGYTFLSPLPGLNQN